MGLIFGSITAGVAVSQDGTQIYAVNEENDSVSIIDAASRRVIREVRLFTPGSTDPRGEYPMWVTPLAGSDGAPRAIYISSVRDGQVIAISVADDAQKVIDLGGAPRR